jgi:prepilin-type processing-associated H-X9-DG protein
MNNNITMNTKRAFTIWELLCVIIVIFLLFALLMPALSRVRTMSSGAICGSYLQTYGILGQQYLNDNDEFFPKAGEWLYTTKSNTESHPIGCRWHDMAMNQTGEIMNKSPEYRGKMWTYFDKRSIRPCPIFRDLTESRVCENPGHKRNIDIEPQYNYTMNGYLGAEENGGVRKQSEVRDPGRVFFFAEENSWSLRPDHSALPATWLSAPLSTKALDDTVLLISPTPNAINCFATYHGAPGGDLNRGYSNVLFVDGHVELISVEDQLRKTMHGGKSRLGPAGNLSWAWASKLPPPGGWDAQ